MKRILFSILGGILALILFISIGLILRQIDYLNAAQAFIKYTVGWSIYLLHPSDFNYPNDIGTTSEIYKSWMINIFVYSLLIYIGMSFRAWWNSRKLNETNV